MYKPIIKILLLTSIAFFQGCSSVTSNDTPNRRTPNNNPGSSGDAGYSSAKDDIKVKQSDSNYDTYQNYQSIDAPVSLKELKKVRRRPVLNIQELNNIMDSNSSNNHPKNHSKKEKHHPSKPDPKAPCTEADCDLQKVIKYNKQKAKNKAIKAHTSEDIVEPIKATAVAPVAPKIETNNHNHPTEKPTKSPNAANTINNSDQQNLNKTLQEKEELIVNRPNDSLKNKPASATKAAPVAAPAPSTPTPVAKPTPVIAPSTPVAQPTPVIAPPTPVAMPAPAAPAPVAKPTPAITLPSIPVPVAAPVTPTRAPIAIPTPPIPAPMANPTPIDPVVIIPPAPVAIPTPPAPALMVNPPVAPPVAATAATNGATPIAVAKFTESHSESKLDTINTILVKYYFNIKHKINNLFQKADN